MISNCLLFAESLAAKLVEAKDDKQQTLHYTDASTKRFFAINF